MLRCPKIALLCATKRGLIVFEKLKQLLPDGKFTVFSFREESAEPPFFSDIKTAAEQGNHRFIEAKRVEAGISGQIWERDEFDLLLAVSWRYLVPERIFRRPRFGAYVFHDSYLPEGRGFSPTVWAIANGHKHTGVTLFEMATGVDEGPIVAQTLVPIASDEVISAVMERVTQLYVSMLEENLPCLLTGSPPRRPQDNTSATYNRKRIPEDDRIVWGRPAIAIFDLIRAITKPYGGAHSTYADQAFKIWSASIPLDSRPSALAPGQVIRVLPGIGSDIQTGEGAIRLQQIQPVGENEISADKVLLRPEMFLK